MDPYSPDALEISMNQNQLKPSIDDMHNARSRSRTNYDARMSNYAGENPEMFNAGIGAITKVLAAAFHDAPEQKGSMVRTQTLPGNSARRRSTQMNIQPIGGSKVTFANEGTSFKTTYVYASGRTDARSRRS
jgi:hypothetical protein